MSELTTGVINFSEKLTDANRELIIGRVRAAMVAPENLTSGVEAWRYCVGPDENVIIGQLTHPDENQRQPISQAVFWYHPEGSDMRRLDRLSREALLNLWYDAATLAWGDEAGTILSEGFSEDESEFNPDGLRHNFFNCAGEMIQVLREQKLLPELPKDRSDEVIKHLPLFERIAAKVRKDGVAVEEFGVDQLGQIIEAMVPKVDIPGFKFNVKTAGQSDGISVEIALGKEVDIKEGILRKQTGEKELQGIYIGFTLGSSNGGLTLRRQVNYVDSKVPGVIKTALAAVNLAGGFFDVKQDISLGGLKTSIMSTLANPQKSLEKTLMEFLKSRGLPFNGLVADLDNQTKRLTLTIK